MTMAWNGRDETFYSEDYMAFFQRHDEYMRRFRLAHPKLETIDSKGVRTESWLALLPVQQVKLVKYWQN